jgi:hypothetical protein
MNVIVALFVMFHFISATFANPLLMIISDVDEETIKMSIE